MVKREKRTMIEDSKEKMRTKRVNGFKRRMETNGS